MKRFLKRFAADCSGAVTVDWVVLCAGVVALAVTAILSIQASSTDLADGVSTYIQNYDFF